MQNQNQKEKKIRVESKHLISFEMIRSHVTPFTTEQLRLKHERKHDRRKETSYFFAGRLAQLVERRTREHNVSGFYRCGFESPASQLKLLIVFRMRR